ncbi:MAG: hypothetical protein ACXWF8_02700 [Methylobacter sp.]
MSSNKHFSLIFEKKNCRLACCGVSLTDSVAAKYLLQIFIIV